MPDSDPEIDLVPGTTLTGSLSGTDDGELDEPLPNAERLVAEAVGLAGQDHATAALVDRFWRFAPDEELVGDTPPGMYGATVEHRELAAVRLPGQLQLEIDPPTDEQQHSVGRIGTGDLRFLVDSV